MPAPAAAASGRNATAAASKRGAARGVHTIPPSTPKGAFECGSLVVRTHSGGGAQAARAPAGIARTAALQCRALGASCSLSAAPESCELVFFLGTSMGLSRHRDRRRLLRGSDCAGRQPGGVNAFAARCVWHWGIGSHLLGTAITGLYRRLFPLQVYTGGSFPGGGRDQTVANPQSSNPRKFGRSWTWWKKPMQQKGHRCDATQSNAKCKHRRSHRRRRRRSGPGPRR